jgi:hypothetical protein
MRHQFFVEIENYPELSNCVRFDIQELPEAHKPNSVKAIVLGADPTNDGVPKNKGLKKLDCVFGIGMSEFERWYFGLQQINLSAIGLSKDTVYVQNVCRNYFTCQTKENKNWYRVASLWVKFLKEEIKSIDKNIPVLATCEEVFTMLTKRKAPFKDIYGLECKLPFYSDDLQRDVFPLFRGRSYMLHEGKWTGYKNYLKNYFE